jgi:hypothetical protein
MTPALYHHHASRLLRLVRDLDVEPAALLADPHDFAIVEGVTQRRLTPALHNQTMAEGLISAIKLADAAIKQELP